MNKYRLTAIAAVFLFAACIPVFAGGFGEDLEYIKNKSFELENKLNQKNPEEADFRLFETFSAFQTVDNNNPEAFDEKTREYLSASFSQIRNTFKMLSNQKGVILKTLYLMVFLTLLTM